MPGPFDWAKAWLGVAAYTRTAAASKTMLVFIEPSLINPEVASLYCCAEELVSLVEKDVQEELARDVVTSHPNCFASRCCNT